MLDIWHKFQSFQITKSGATSYLWSGPFYTLSGCERDLFIFTSVFLFFSPLWTDLKLLDNIIKADKYQLIVILMRHEIIQRSWKCLKCSIYMKLKESKQQVVALCGAVWIIDVTNTRQHLPLGLLRFSLGLKYQ